MLFSVFVPCPCTVTATSWTCHCPTQPHLWHFKTWDLRQCPIYPVFSLPILSPHCDLQTVDSSLFPQFVTFLVSFSSQLGPFDHGHSRVNNSNNAACLSTSSTRHGPGPTKSLLCSNGALSGHGLPENCSQTPTHAGLQSAKSQSRMNPPVLRHPLIIF